MANRLRHTSQDLRETRVWRSIFRSGSGTSNLHRSLAVQQNVFLHLSSVKIRKRSLAFQVTWFLGTLSLGAFLILVCTGIPLMLYYHPSVPQAYADMKDLQFVVSAGVFLRNLHRWSAHAMVLLVFAHMFKVFYRGAYRPPREFNWVIGVVLLMLTLFLSYTGYLLPWDQLAFWAITVGSNHHVGGAGAGPEDPLPDAGRQHGERERAAAVLRAALRDSAAAAASSVSRFISGAFAKMADLYTGERASRMSEPKKFVAALDSDSREVAGARGVRYAADVAAR